MPHQCMGHVCSCGAVWTFNMSDIHRRGRNLSIIQAGCCNVQYNPAAEYCISRPIVSCPECSPQLWNSHELLSVFTRTRVYGGMEATVTPQSPPALYVYPGHQQFIGPMPPPPCHCEACGG